MSTTQITNRIAETSPRVGSRFIGIYYLLTIATGTFVLLFHGKQAFVADLVVGTVYLAATVFLYVTTPVSKGNRR